MADDTEVGGFSFIAGTLCLDFVNTAFREDGVAVCDGLAGYGDLLAWSVAAQMLTPAHAETLRSLARERAAEAGAAFARAIGLREAAFRIFTAVAQNVSPAPADMLSMDETQRDAFAHRLLVADGGGFRWDWSGGGTALDQVLWRVAESATDLLTRGDLKRVRRCAGEDCTRLFLDTSRSGRRRWCDMSHCGNIAKVRRFRTRHREDVPEAAP